MQIQHEAQLLECGPISNGEDLASLVVLNQTLDIYTLCHQQSRISIEHLVSNPVNSIIAVYLSTTNQIVLIDTKTYQKRERFPLKACDKKFSKKSFTLKGFDFSPDGSRLAVGQSDCIVYIYKLFATSTTTTAAATPTATTTSTTNQQQQSDATTTTTTATNTTPTTSNNLKPTITGKFACSSPITCLIWSELGIIFGTQDGKIKLISLGSKSSSAISAPEINQGSLMSTPVATIAPVQSGPTTALSSSSSTTTTTTTSNPAKVINVYTASKGSIPLALSFKFPSMLAVSLTDSSVLLLTLPVELNSSLLSSLTNDLITVANSIGNNQSNPGNTNFESPFNYNRRHSSFQSNTSIISIEHTNPVYYLTIIQNNTICCAGYDGKISFHSTQQQQQQQQPLNNNVKASINTNLIQSIDLKEEILAFDYSTINETLALASKSKLSFIKYDQESNSWQLQNSFIQLANVYSLTSLIWTKEGSQLAVGTSIGSLELFKCSWSKQTISDQLDICHIAKNRVRITDRARNLLATYKTQHDIKRVNLLNNNQSVIIWTSQSILLAKLGYLNQSEIPWNGDKKIKFSFDYQDFVLLYQILTKEILLVRLGNDYVIFKMKFETIDRQLISARQYPSLSLFISSNYNSMMDTNQALILENNKISPTSMRQRSAGSSSARSNRNSSSGSLMAEVNQFNETIVAGNQLLTTSEINNSDNQSNNARIPDCESLEERIAYVNELICIHVIDLRNKRKVFSLNHSHKVVSIELSCTNKSLIFKDSLNILYLVGLTIETNSPQKAAEDSQPNSPQVLIENCVFAKWLFESNILIAQSEYKIHIWFDIETSSKSKIIDSRSFNINNSPPLIDLSLSKMVRITATTLKTATKDKMIECSTTKKRSYPTIVKTTSDQLILSNNYSIQLDKTKIKFYTEIHKQRLDLAYEVLEREQDSKKGNLSLFHKLGWLSIEQNDCFIALKVFKSLGHKGMVEYLEKCNEIGEEKEWRLAILRGDWDLFEQLVDSSQVISTYKRLNKWSRAIDYLNKTQQFRQRDIIEQEFKDWLVNKGQFKRAAEIQVKTGDLTSALELLIDNKAIEDATDLFIREQKNCLIKSRLQTQVELKLLELAKNLKQQLIESGNYLKAALICEKLLSETEEAIELYIQGEDYSTAIDLVKSNGKSEVSTDREQKLSDIQLAFANYLMKQFRTNRLSKKKVIPAIDQYIASGNFIEALKASIELSEFYKAYEILKQSMTLYSEESQQSNEMAEYCLKVGNFLLDNNLKKLEDDDNQKMAIEVYLIGKQYEKVIDLYLKEGNFNEAFNLSLKYKNSNSKDETVKEFSELAQVKCNEGLFEEAKKIYLMLDMPDKAIEILKEAKMFDKMLELVEQYYQDSLESNLLLLARQFESEGNFKEAEKYLLRASQSEWVNVVRMYRLNGQWNEAFRVAKKYCNSERDPLLVQLAYWWSKSICQKGEQTRGQEEAYKLLKELNLFNLVLEFCCENKNFQFAIDICNTNNNNPELNNLKQDFVKKYATYLEEEHKFEKAEQVLLENDQIEEATRMYIDNEMYADSIRIIENKLENQHQELSKDLGDQLVGLLNKTLVLCANRISEEVKPTLDNNKGISVIKQTNNTFKASKLKSDSVSEKLQTAQQMYLRAQRPDLAVELYKERGMWQEAIQVAQRFAPQLLESVEQALDSQVERDVGEIMVSTGGGNSTTNRSASSLSTSTNHLMSNSSLINDNNDQLDGTNNIVSTTRNTSTTLGAQNIGKTVDYLRDKADNLMKNGDTFGAKQALGKFIESLVDGTKSKHQGEATLALISKQLYQIERKIIKQQHQKDVSIDSTDLSREISLQLIDIANDIGATCLWGSSICVPTNQNDEQLVVWIRLRNLLSDYLIILSEQQKQERVVVVGGGKTNKTELIYNKNNGLERSNLEAAATDGLLSYSDSTTLNFKSNFKEQLKRRLLIAHYVILHAAYVSHLQQVNLGQQQQHHILKPSNAEQYFKSLLGNSSGSKSSKQAMLLFGRSSQQQRNTSSSNSSTEQILTCLAKLSLSLLRYSDILEAQSSFYIAGLWLLAAGWRDWAYFVWSRLIEICEPSQARSGDLSNGSQAIITSNSKFELELKRAGIPLLTQQSDVNGGNKLQEKSGNFATTAKKKVEEGSLLSNVFVKEEEKQEQLSQVRAWLLECLLEKDGSGAISRLVLDERGQFECSLSAPPGFNSNQQQQQQPQLVESCLLCGYPVFAAAAAATSSRGEGEGGGKFSFNSEAKLNFCVHLNEWKSLQLIAKQPNNALDNNQTVRQFEKGSGKNEWEHLQRLTLVGSNSKNLTPSRQQESSLTPNEIACEQKIQFKEKEKKKRPIIRLGDVIDFLIKLGDNNPPVK